MKRIFFIFFNLLLLLCVFVSAVAAEEKIGLVEAVFPRAWANRIGKEITLKISSEIFLNDTLTTGRKGELVIKLNDATIISLAADSEIAVSEFVMDDKQNSFGAEITKGTARLVTGSLVKRNPDGFKVNTPYSSVGIRGTTVLFSISDGREVISVRELGKGSSVSVLDKASGAVYIIDQVNQTFFRKIGELGGIFKDNADINRIVNRLENSITISIPNVNLPSAPSLPSLPSLPRIKIP